MKLARPLVLLTAFALAPLVHAEDLLGIYNLALQQDPQLAEARARYAADHTLLAQNRATLMPTVSANANTARNARGPENTFSYADASNSNGYNVNLQQAVVDFAAWYNWKSAKAEDQRAQAQLMKGEQEMIMRVARAYFEVLRAQESLGVADAELNAASASLDLQQARFDVDLAAITDVNQAQANADLARVSRLREERALNQARLALEVITGSAHEQLEGLSGRFPIIPVEPASADAWVQLADESSPDVQVARFDFAAKTEDAKAARSALLPRVTASATYNWAAATQNPFAVRANEAQEAAILQLNLTMPIFNGGANRARMRQAYHLRTLSEQTKVRTERENARSTRDSFLGVETDVLAVRAGQQAVVSAQSALDAVNTGLEIGTRNTVDVVGAQRDLFRAQRDLARARYDYVIDTLLLKQAAGVLSPEDVRALNEWLE
ncbi:MAG: TolC family outer membrane protein [Pseudomonadota bacterium]